MLLRLLCVHLKCSEVDPCFETYFCINIVLCWTEEQITVLWPIWLQQEHLVSMPSKSTYCNQDHMEDCKFRAHGNGPERTTYASTLVDLLKSIESRRTKPPSFLTTILNNHLVRSACNRKVVKTNKKGDLSKLELIDKKKWLLRT